MKIITWNCHFGFTEEKANFISKINADIYVIQETLEENNKNIKLWENSIWYGDYVDSKYGVSLFSSKYTFKFLDCFNKDYRYVVPVLAESANESHILFIVWTKNKDKENKNIEYTEQLFGTLFDKNYIDIFKKKVIILGDFNSGVRWDEELARANKPNHTDIVNKFNEYNITSAYHDFYGFNQGYELHPTLYWNYKGNLLPFHIDYCFVSNNYKIINLKVGTYDDYIKPKLSDHCPLIIDTENK
jgi:endonuclease/exonuclease/phosphatase family metal-dependent hydrolase